MAETLTDRPLIINSSAGDRGRVHVPEPVLGTERTGPEHPTVRVIEPFELPEDL